MNKLFARRIAVIAGVVAAALIVVPAALGNAQPADRSTPADFWNYDPATGARVADTSPGIAAHELAGLMSGDAVTVATVEPGNGRDFEWAQVGVGFGLGLLVVTGVWLAVRVMRTRVLAH